MARLQEMHPKLAPTTVADCLHKVALGLARHNHRGAVHLETVFDETEQDVMLRWRETDGDANILDFNRVTEDAADAIALAVVHVANGWTVRRRAQREEHADWLLLDVDNRPVALEVSGVDMIDHYQRRLTEKATQVGQHPNWRASKVACVVEFNPPRCRLKTAG